MRTKTHRDRRQSRATEHRSRDRTRAPQEATRRKRLVSTPKPTRDDGQPTRAHRPSSSAPSSNAPALAPTNAYFETLLLQNLSLIERLAHRAARRMGIKGADADDFVADVTLKLIDNDYKVLRRRRGGSKLSTYLHVVIYNLARDTRIKRRGKWRPSAAAKRLGKVAVRLEELLYREGWSFDEATSLLVENDEVEHGSEHLADLAAQLPARTLRTFITLDTLQHYPSRSTADERLHRDQRLKLVAHGLRELRAEDRLLLKERFVDGKTAAVIARSLGIRPRSVYSRIDRHIRHIRKITRPLSPG